MTAPAGDKLKLTDRMVPFLNYILQIPYKLFMKTKESAERLKADVVGYPPKCKGFFECGGGFAQIFS